MSTQEKTWNVANRLHSQKDSDNPEVNHIIAGADEIYDDTKGAKQSDINAQTETALADRYTKDETYNQQELNSLITTPDVSHVSVVATSGTTVVTDVLPTTGAADTIYRIGNWDGTQYDPTVYSLYAWNGTAYVCLAVRPLVGEVYDISVNHPDGQGNPTPYADLAAALGSDGENIPAGIRRGGMSIKFVLRTNTGTEEEPVYKDEYVQYRLMNTAWSTIAGDWQGVDNEPVAGSKNFVESGGVFNFGLATEGKDISSSLGAWSNNGNTSYATFDLDASGHNGTWTLLKSSGAAQRIRIDCNNLIDGEIYRIRFNFVTSNGLPLSTIGFGETIASDTWETLIDIYGNSILTRNGIIDFTFVKSFRYLLIAHNAVSLTFPMTATVSDFSCERCYVLNEIGKEIDDEPTTGSNKFVRSGGVKAIEDKQDKIANSDIHAVQYINPSFVIWNANVSVEKIVAADNYRCDVYELKKGEVLYFHIYQDGTGNKFKTNLWKCIEKPAVDSAVKLIEAGTIQDGTECNRAYIATEDCYVILERYQRNAVNVIASKRNEALDTVPLYVVEPLKYTTGSALGYICCNPDDEHYGEAVSQSFYTARATDFVDITGAKFLRILLRSANANIAVLDFGHMFYDSDKQPISVMAKFNVGFSYALYTYIPVPANAAYARFTVRDGDQFFILKDLIGNRFDSTDNTIKEVANSIDGLDNVVEHKKEYPFSMYNNYYKNVSLVGDKCTVISADDRSRLLSFVPVKKDEVYKFTYSGRVNRWLTLSIFDVPPVDVGVEGTLLFSGGIPTEGGTLTAIVKMPKDGYLARAVYLDSAPAILNQYKLADDGFDEDVYIKQNVETSWTNDSLIDIDPNSENYGIVQTGVTNNNYITSDYINVEGVKYVLLMATKSSAGFTVPNYLNNTFGSIFYDENKNPIDWSGFPVEVYYRKATVVTRNQGLCFIPVPDNAAYLRVTNYIGVYTVIALKDKLSEIDFTKIVEDGKDYKGLLAQAKFVANSPTIQSLGLVHFSDIHGDQTSADAIRKFIGDYSQYITDVLCTGDSVHYYADPTSGYSHGSAWWKETSKIADKSLFVLGNHESATPASTEYDQKEDSAAWDGKGKDWCFTTYIEPYIETLGYVMPNGYNDSTSPNYHACYWHKDYAAQKIRVIGLDCLHRFDGVLNPATGEITTAGVKWTTNEQELWLIEKLNETLDSANAAYGYSVIVACHYPIDNFSGNNEEWDDTTHKFVYNRNAAGGRVMDFKTGDVVGFHWERTTSYVADLKFNMKNRVDDGYIDKSKAFPNYTKGSTNNVANIIQNWMNNGGKFVVWLCGHTHVDFMWYSTNYPDILCVVIDQAGCLRGTNTGDRSTNLDSRVCANYYSIDTQNGLFKIIRVGYTMNKLMNSHEYLCYDYINRKVLNEG